MSGEVALSFLIGFFLGEWFMAWRWKHTERRKNKKGGLVNDATDNV